MAHVCVLLYAHSLKFISNEPSAKRQKKAQSGETESCMRNNIKGVDDLQVCDIHLLIYSQGSAAAILNTQV